MRSPTSRRAGSPTRIEECWNQIRNLNAEVERLKNENQDLLAHNSSLKLQLDETRYMATQSEDFIEKRVTTLQSETEFWKTKCDQLSNKFYVQLRKLREEKEEIKTSMQTQLDDLREATQSRIDELRRTYNKVSL